MARPSKPAVRGSRSGKPLMAFFDLVGRRWALRVLWELRAGQLTSRELRLACGGISPTVVSDRSRELREAGLVELEETGGYVLTALGTELVERFLPLAAWSERWAQASSKM